MKRLIVVLLAAMFVTSGCSAYSAAFSSTITITAQFRDSVGLYVDNDVTMLGISIGKVKRIQPDGTYTNVELEINADNKIPANAGAVTISPSVVTDRHVEITPAYRGGPTMRDGDLIPLDRTRTPVEFDKVIQSVDELSAQLAKTDGGRGVISDATDVAARNLQGNGKRINDTIRAMASAVDSGAGQRDALISLIKNVDQLTGAAARNDGQIRSFSGKLAAATKLLSEEAPAMSGMLQRMNGLLDETTSLINKYRGPAHDSLKKAVRTLRTMASHRDDLAETIDTLPLLSQNVSRAVDRKTGQIRVHADLFQQVMDTDAINILCRRFEIQLPGCRSGRAADFGPDLGMTELLLGAVR